MEQPAGREVLQIQVGETKIRFCEDYCKELGEGDMRKLLRELAGELYPLLRAERIKQGENKKSSP